MVAPWKSIQPSERGLTGSLAATYFLIIGAFTTAKIARDSLFLTELPAAYLPYMYVGLALLSAVATVALGRLRIGSARRRIAFMLVLTGISLVLFAGWFRIAPGVAAIAFYLWTGVYGVALVAEFWLLGNEAVDTRQARRLFGPIGAGGVLGGLVAAAAATSLGRSLDPVWFLIIAGAAYSVCAAFVLRVPVGAAETAEQTGPEAQSQLSSRELLTQPYARLLVALFLTAGVAIGVLDYSFKLVLQDQLADGGQIASALGAFYSVQGIVSIIAQVGLTGLVLSRFGHRPAANALPVGLLLGSVVALGTPATVAALAIVGSRLYELAMRFSMTRTAWEFLYFPLTSDVKARLKRLVDVVVNRSADALAGLLLLLINAVSSGTLFQLSMVLVALIAAWLILELRLNRAYAREVDQSLRRLAPEPSEDTLELRKLVHADELLEGLESSNTDSVLEAMKLLERIDPSVVLESACRLAVHDSPEVRARLLAVASEAGWDPSEFPPLEPRRDRDAYGAPVGLGLEEGPDERVAIAAAAARDDGRDYIDHLGPLITDPNDDVRRAAIRSAGLVGDMRLAPALVGRLGVIRDRSAAHDALVALGEPVLDLLAYVLLDPTEPAATRLAAVAVLEDFASLDSARILYEAVDGAGQRRIGDAALRGLSRIRRAQPDLELPADRIVADVDREIERDARHLVQLGILRRGANPRNREFITRVVRERTEAAFLRIFRRLSLVYTGGALMSAYRGLRSGNKRTRAQAIEYLDTLLPREVARKLLPLVEAEDLEGRQLSAIRVFGLEQTSLDSTLAELIQDRDPWLCACGLHIAGYSGKGEFLDRVRAQRDSMDPIVRETARWAVERLR